MARATHGATSGCTMKLWFYDLTMKAILQGGVKRQLQEGNEKQKNKMKSSSNADDGTIQKKQKSESSMSGHLRIGWSTCSADLEAPVG